MPGHRIKAIVSDFGGVLTTPLLDSFMAVQDETGIGIEDLAKAMESAEQELGAHPLFELEKGRMTEADFLALLERHLAPQLGHQPHLNRFRELYFDALHPNEPMIALMTDLKSRGYRMALLTNNIREWEPHWRSMLPVDEIFELVVDSAFVEMRKPEPEIYHLTLDRLGDGLTPPDCLFIDDTEVNCQAAAELGMATVLYESPDQAAKAIASVLAKAVADQR